MVVRRARRQSLTILGDIAQRTDRGRRFELGRTCCATRASTRFDDRGARAQLPRARRLPAHRRRAVAGRARACRAACARRRGRRSPCDTDAAASGGRRGARRAHERRRRQRRRRRPAGAARRGDPRGARRGRRTPTPSDGALGPGVNLLGLARRSRASSSTRSSCVEPAAILDERPDGGRGGLYTALTRSTRALAVVHAEPLPFSAPDLHPVSDADPASAWAARRR